MALFVLIIMSKTTKRKMETKRRTMRHCALMNTMSTLETEEKSIKSSDDEKRSTDYRVE